jgi:hypothetical protein
LICFELKELCQREYLLQVMFRMVKQVVIWGMKDSVCDEWQH